LEVWEEVDLVALLFLHDTITLCRNGCPALQCRKVKIVDQVIVIVSGKTIIPRMVVADMLKDWVGLI